METNPKRELRFAGAATIRGLRPTSGRLLVRLEPDPAEPVQLIALPTGSEAERRRIRRGAVVAQPVNDGISPEPEVRVGDVVLFPAACGHGLRLRINGQEHVLVREKDVLATVEES